VAGGLWRRVLPGVYARSTGALDTEQREIAALSLSWPGFIVPRARRAG